MRTVQSRITARENVVNMRIHLLKKGVRNFPHTLQRESAARNYVGRVDLGWLSPPMGNLTVNAVPVPGMLETPMVP